ncbi:peptidase C15 [Roseibium algae]|uniref:Pyrrolidone-carboxylate peptidase n=1 Tax=Roseibium algae TaxID=3123038 RepID=A0ABU8TI82_9HYPH
MTKTILVTGFEPFPGASINPTALLIARLPKRLPASIGEVRFHFARLPTTWAARHSVTDKLRRTLQPAAIIHFGVDGSRRGINVETRAVNCATRVKPDAVGEHASLPHLNSNGPSSRSSTLPVRTLREAASRSGAPVSLSRDAGTYLCNATLWDSIGSGIPSVFVHVPPLPRGRFDKRPCLQQVEAAAVQILREIARRI